MIFPSRLGAARHNFSPLPTARGGPSGSARSEPRRSSTRPAGSRRPSSGARAGVGGGRSARRRPQPAARPGRLRGAPEWRQRAEGKRKRKKRKKKERKKENRKDPARSTGCCRRPAFPFFHPPGAAAPAAARAAADPGPAPRDSALRPQLRAPRRDGAGAGRGAAGGAMTSQAAVRPRPPRRFRPPGCRGDEYTARPCAGARSPP